MNKEENKFYPNELTTEILDELWLDMSFHKDYIKHKYEFYKLRDSYYLLQQENKQLKERIDKAIEYIESEKVIKDGNTLEQITNYEKNILEILKGE